MPTMHPLKLEYYDRYLIATVNLKHDGEFEVVGGREEKRRLNRAKRESTFCYVKDIVSRQSVKLNLVDDEWRPE